MFWEALCLPHQESFSGITAETSTTRKAFGNTLPGELNYDPEFLLLVSIPNTTIPAFNRAHSSPAVVNFAQSEAQKPVKRTVSWESDVQKPKSSHQPRAPAHCRTGGVGVQPSSYFLTQNGRMLTDKEKFEAMVAQTKDCQAEESRQRRILEYSRLTAAARNAEMKTRQGMCMEVKSVAKESKIVSKIHKDFHKPTCKCEECEKLVDNRMAQLRLQEDLDREMKKANRGANRGQPRTASC